MKFCSIVSRIFETMIGSGIYLCKYMRFWIMIRFVFSRKHVVLNVSSWFPVGYYDLLVLGLKISVESLDRLWCVEMEF